MIRLYVFDCKYKIKAFSNQLLQLLLWPSGAHRHRDHEADGSGHPENAEDRANKLANYQGHIA